MVSRLSIVGKPRALEHRVYPVVKTSAECVGDRLLAELLCGKGPAGDLVREKLHNLLEGSAWEQTVVYLMEEATERLLAVAEVCLDGHPRRRTIQPAYVRRIGGNPYVNLVVRDERFYNHVLLDGRTRLGTAALRGVLEAVLRDRPQRSGELPLVWGWVDPENRASLRAFATVGFRPRGQDADCGSSAQDSVVVGAKRDVTVIRPAGKPLPAPSSAYVPLPVEQRRLRASAL